MIYLWRKIKAISYLREIVATVYYFLHKTRRNIRGNDNLIKVELKEHFPFLKNVTFSINGDGNTVIINSGVRLSNTKIEIRGHHNKLIIGENCQIASGCLWIEDYDCKLLIGKGTTIGEANIGVSEPKSSVVIGEDCMLSHSVDIRCGDSHSILDIASSQRINYAQDVHIGNHVWIAKSVQILKGVYIGNNSIVAAGSIVTKDVPENCLVAGVPAQVKRTGLTWLREKVSRECDSNSFDN